MGSSGEGKSTLAGYFHQTGDPALCDDCVRIQDEEEAVSAVPSYAGLRLWEDTRLFLFPNVEEPTAMAHYSPKQRLIVSKPDPLPAPGESLPVYSILAIISLVAHGFPGSEPARLEKLSMREAFIAIMKQIFLLDVTQQAQFSHLMQEVGKVVPRVRSFRLTLPHDYNLLPQVRQMILKGIASNP
jgi:hypothetical protein